MAGTKISTGLTLKTTEISSNDLFETSEYQSVGVYTSKKSVFGEWLSHTFNSGDFTATGGAFNVTDPDEQVNKYKIIGKTMYWSIIVVGQIISAPSSLFIKIPGGYSAKSKVIIQNAFVEAQVGGVVTILGGADPTKIEIKTHNGADLTTNFSANLYFSLTFEIL